ncbi:MAG: carboxypeptidase M32 [Candidatus Hodarchaeales archaeon]|jgi:carboxypeptidase Taq
MKPAYSKLMGIFKELNLLRSIQGVLYWDLNTYMPSEGLKYRSSQFNWIQTRIHQIWTGDEIKSLLDKSMSDPGLDEIASRNIELMRREYENRTVLPTELVGALAAQSNKTLEVWKKAKKDENFQIVIEEMEKLFDLNLQRANLLAEKKRVKDSFDALIMIRDPSFSVKTLSTLFDEVKVFLIPLIKNIQNSGIEPRDGFLSRKVSKRNQLQIVNELADFLGYDFNKGRIDEVEHPLTIGCGPEDVRITVKYQEDNIMKAVGATIHEVGHGLHGLQRKREWSEQPINNFHFPSFGESQSRLLENHIGLSKSFWKAYFPLFQKGTHGSFVDISVDDFYPAINQVKPGVSRMRADEVTYILHIIIRFEIERDLFAGKITINDLPSVWNEKYESYLGVEVPNDTVGVMQDLHWYSQYWGYFFGYAVGDLMAAQIMKAGLDKDLPNWRGKLEEGEFSSIRKWLQQKVHSLGVKYDSLELIKKITGETLSTKYFKNYLELKYAKLYNL